MKLFEALNEQQNKIQLPFVHLFKDFYNFFNNLVTCHMYTPLFSSNVCSDIIISYSDVLSRTFVHIGKF